ncbi:MAG: hypothetical protein H7222_13140 [Methylotenera sp.]|nr:hypothetical protein [Oligoflexia bacterium]
MAIYSKFSIAGIMSRIFGGASPSGIWLSFFVLWILFLSGVMNGIVGSPGALQAVRLTHLLTSKQDKLTALEDEVKRLDEDSNLLEKSRLAQELEIRRVLGYAGEDELIFDFTTVRQAAPLRETH